MVKERMILESAVVVAWYYHDSPLEFQVINSVPILGWALISDDANLTDYPTRTFVVKLTVMFDTSPTTLLVPVILPTVTTPAVILTLTVP